MSNEGEKQSFLFHLVTSSLYEEGIGQRSRPTITKEETAWKVIQAYESQTLADTEKFVRYTKNALAFYSFELKINEDSPT